MVDHGPGPTRPDPHPDRHPAEPVDPDVERPRLRLDPLVLACIAAGGVAGALARYAAGRLWPTADGAFPWTTLTVNAVGCVLIGVVVVLTSEVFTAHRLIRPTLATGVLGGFTTFSTYAVDGERLLRTGHQGTAVADLVLSVVVCLAAVTVGTTLTRRAFEGR